MVAIAFESLIKLVVLLMIGAYALFGVFGGPGGPRRLAAGPPEALEALYRPVNESPWERPGVPVVRRRVPAAAPVPHAVRGEPRRAGLRTATWAMPAFLLLLEHLDPGDPVGRPETAVWAINPDYFVLGITFSDGPSWLSLLAFVGGTVGASAMVIVTSIALASMSLNHLLLPGQLPGPGDEPVSLDPVGPLAVDWPDHHGRLRLYAGPGSARAWSNSA